MRNKTALIIGGGPAGLVAAYELLTKSDIKPIILERDGVVGGISKTISFNGNLVDIGPHRFFSKLSRVNRMWQSLLKTQGKPSWDDLVLSRDFKERSESGDPESQDDVLLVRDRLTRIFFLNKFFNYPINFSRSTLVNLGIRRIAKVILSYMAIKLKPIKAEKSLEDFYVNRFGRELYNTFFKDYTKKVWGLIVIKSLPTGARRG